MTTRKITHTFPSLAGTRCVSLITFRRSGVAVATPVWFATHNGTLYVRTALQAGKIKRIRHTNRVELAPCTARGKITGAAVEGRARIVESAEETRLASKALAKKYGFGRKLYYFVKGAMRVVRPRGPLVSTYVAIEPVLR